MKYRFFPGAYRGALVPVLALALSALAGCGGHKASTDAARHAPAASGSAQAGAAAGRYAAVARGRIDVEGGMLDLYVPVSGTVDHVAVHEGDHVHKGQLLARLDTQSAQANLDIAQGKLEQARAHSQVLEQRLKAAKADASKLRAAADAGAGSMHDATAAAQKVDELKGESDEARAAVDIARGQLAIARHQLALHRITAPVAGNITQVHIQDGSRAEAGATAAFELLPDRARIVRAELNQEYVDAVHKGMRAEVVLDNDRQTPLGTAHVERVGDIYSPSKLQDNPALTAGTRTVPCVLRFDKPVHLRIGQLVLVRILRTQGNPAGDDTRKGS